MGSILKTDKLCKSFSNGGVQQHIIKNLDLEIMEGDCTVIMGASGSGKSTFLRCLNCMEDPTGGSIFFRGEDIADMKVDINLHREHIGMVFQSFNLFPQYTALQNVTLARELMAKNEKTGEKLEDIRAEGRELLAMMGLQDRMSNYPHQLSGGMRQRAALLRTYLFSQDVALLDEPFSALDTLTKSAIHRWFLDVMEQIRLSTLFITHDIDEAILLSDRIYLLSGAPGKIAGEIVIREAKPRRSDFPLSAEFLEYKRQILALIHEGE